MLQGVESLTGVVREVAQANGKRRSVRSIVQGTAKVSEQARVIKTAPPPTRAGATQSLAQSGADMRKMARQTMQATASRRRRSGTSCA